MIAALPPAWALQKFERELLVDEVAGLTGVAAEWEGDRVVALGADPSVVPMLVERLALARAVVAPDGSVHTTRQRRLEAAVRGGARKVTSHALHGLHPYKGKFYPQLARAILNSCGVPHRGCVFDPFAGCGTTVLEADLMGLRGFGVDANPLAVKIANTKIRVLRRDSDELATALAGLRTLPRRGVALPDDYLERWFPKANLAYLLRVLKGIDGIKDPDAKDLALICLSSVLRECSLQDPAQIRVCRRRDITGIKILAEAFPRALVDSISALSAARDALRGMENVATPPAVELGDARDLPADGERRIDAVVTSPPYANALPYIDTDRLSLRAFSLLGQGGQRAAERRLIGNREITDADARRLEAEAESAIKRGELPERFTALFLQTRRVAKESSSGFRKRRTPALLFAYFRDMGHVLTGLEKRLKSNAPAVLVVGDSTVAGPRGSRLNVETTRLVAELASSRGFRVEREIGKPLTSFGAADTRHQRNAMAEERILVLRTA